jgi:hypothetical protein
MSARNPTPTERRRLSKWPRTRITLPALVWGSVAIASLGFTAVAVLWGFTVGRTQTVNAARAESEGRDQSRNDDRDVRDFVNGIRTAIHSRTSGGIHLSRERLLASSAIGTSPTAQDAGYILAATFLTKNEAELTQAGYFYGPRILDEGDAALIARNRRALLMQIAKHLGTAPAQQEAQLFGIRTNVLTKSAACIRFSDDLAD